MFSKFLLLTLCGPKSTAEGPVNMRLLVLCSDATGANANMDSILPFNSGWELIATKKTVVPDMIILNFCLCKCFDTIQKIVYPLKRQYNSILVFLLYSR